MHLLYFFLYFFDVYFALNRVFFSKFGELFVNNCTIVVLFVFLSLLLCHEKYVQTYGVAHNWAVRRFSHQIGNYMTPVIEDRHKVASMALEQESGIREALGKKMVDLGLTYQKLSDISGTSVQTIKNLIETREGYKSETLLSIANHLGFGLALVPNQDVPRISVSIKEWSGWNINSSDTWPYSMKSISDAIDIVKKPGVVQWAIIDANKFLAFISDGSVADYAVKTAREKWKIALVNIKIGLPE